MISIKTEKEIEVLAEGGKHLSKIINQLIKLIKPGISTLELDSFFEKQVKKINGKPSFKGYKGYPASACISINEEIVHGIPQKDRILEVGQIVSVDVGMEYKKLFTDMAVTIAVGKVSTDIEDLLKITREALYKGINIAKPGKHLGDISASIMGIAQKHNFGIIKELTGHGVGYAVHEEPSIPNYGVAGSGPILKPGMVFALEPMFSLGKDEIKIADDGWTAYTKDRSLSAHFEHTIVITKKGAKIITVDKE